MVKISNTKSFIILTIFILIIIVSSAYAESNETSIRYIYNTDFHGALLYSYCNSIQGILMNGTEIQTTWIKYYDEHSDRICVQLPGMGALLWIPSNELVDQWPDDIEKDILTGIVHLSELGRIRLETSYGDLSYQEKLYNNSRVKVAGRINTMYYLPDIEPHYILIEDIRAFADHKYRHYWQDMLSFIELPRRGEKDGTENMTEEEALNIGQDTLQRFYSDLPTNGEYQVYLNFEHLYGTVGKTWVVDYSIQDIDGETPCLYEVEIIDKDRKVMTVYSAYDIDMPEYLVKDGIILTVYSY